MKYTFIYHLVGDFEKEDLTSWKLRADYRKRYESIDSPSRSYWAPYIVKKVTTTIGDDDEALDCGLYCEEFNNCDFFVHSDSDCYMGTFRVLEKIGTDLVSSWGSRYFGPMFLVYKSKFKHFLLSFLISARILLESRRFLAFD